METKTPILKAEETIFSIDEENKICFDCKNKSSVFGSVNQGITLCEDCAKVHEQFGPSISYVKLLSSEWDDYLLNFFVLGSNTKFKKFFEVIGLNPDLPIETKYKTFAVDYYRRNLKAKVKGLKLLDIDFTDPNGIMTNPTDSFPEFTNYQLNLGGPKEEQKKQPQGAGKKIAGFFTMFGKKIVKAGKEIGEKVEEIKIGQTIKTGGGKALQGLKKAGTFVANKAAPATTQIKKGAKFIENAFEDLKEKIVHNKKEDKEEQAIVVDINAAGESENNHEEEKKEDHKSQDPNPESTSQAATSSETTKDTKTEATDSVPQPTPQPTPQPEGQVNEGQTNEQPEPKLEANPESHPEPQPETQPQANPEAEQIANPPKEEEKKIEENKEEEKKE